MDDPTQYCERLAGALTEPINTFTNLAFLAASFLVYMLIKQSGTQNRLLQLLPVSIFLIGLGSAIWHHSSAPLGDVLDTAGIALFALIASVFVVTQLFKKSYWRLGILIVAAGSTLYLEQLPYLNGSLVYVFLFTILSLALLQLTRLHGLPVKYTILATALLFTGLAARTFDVATCDLIWFGIHFIWHIAIASALYFVSIVFIKATISTQ